MIKKKILTEVGGAAQANKIKAQRCFQVDYIMLFFHNSDLHLILCESFYSKIECYFELDFKNQFPYIFHLR